ncbi:MAG: F0F1 ATP synthase subunit A [Phycisphaerales bacterium]|nr:F0F1 ATP synthase subunit A [Phycisphaerales bacterium]MCB9858711.1 F0F1 ATP synthase subunit A [Phycisphaerales bacterium]MCB9864433.1 F0F1 ATP synthase subunit A [Phycisphaerales bacterium]
MTGLMLASSDPLSHVLPHPLMEKPFAQWPWEWKDPWIGLVSFSPHDSFFTNHLLMTLVSAVILLLLFPILGRKYATMSAQGADKIIPTGFANCIEAVMQYIREDVVRPVLDTKTDRFMPFLWTLFFYILTCNLLGMIPLGDIIGVITGGKVQHIGGTATGNIMITAGLAVCAFLTIHFSGAKEVFRDLVAGTYGHHHSHDEEHAMHGEGHPYGLAHDAEHPGHHAHNKGKSPVIAIFMAPVLYVWNFAPHVFMPEKIDGPGAALLVIADFIMWAILLVLESIGAVVKPFALAIRLFANMVAGHVVLASILALAIALKTVMQQSTVGFAVVLGCAGLSCLELFVAFLQAYVFVFLTTLFIGASVSPEH